MTEQTAEKKGTDTMTFSVPLGFREKLKQFSERSGLSLSKIVVRATTRYITQAEQQARINNPKAGMGEL